MGQSTPTFFGGRGVGGRPSENCTQFITLALWHVDWKRFCEDTPSSPQVIEPNKLNLRPNFPFSRLQFLGKTPVCLSECATKAWSNCSACKNFRAQHPLGAEIQCILVGLNSHLDLCNYWTEVHRTYFLERRRNRAGNISFPILDILSRSGDIRDQSRRLYKIDWNCACFWPSNFMVDVPPPPNFGTWIITHDQFLIMWQSLTAVCREISEITRWKKKHHEQNRRPPVLPYGRSNNHFMSLCTYSWAGWVGLEFNPCGQQDNVCNFCKVQVIFFMLPHSANNCRKYGFQCWVAAIDV